MLLIAVIGLAVVMLVSSLYYRSILERSLFARLRDLDYIRANGLPPERWLRKGAPPRWDGRGLRRARALRRFVKHTRMVESEEVRSLVMDELDRIIKDNG
ncbi:MAG: hypothetical protein LBS11_07305 [Oscillospiraceae bacterium]|nr:hypothetical protein [Oscillospiraceae bacterium]